MKIQMYNNPALYNACTNHKIDDIPFYQYWAKEANGSILELACGTGRVAKPLLDKGYNYTGLDLSPVFIDHCKSKYPNGQFITSDMRDFNLGQKFDLISIPFNSFLHLYTEDEMNRCLKSAQNHLAKNGQFLLDIFVPDPEFLYRDPNKRYEEMTITHPQGGECIIWQIVTSRPGLKLLRRIPTIDGIQEFVGAWCVCVGEGPNPIPIVIGHRSTLAAPIVKTPIHINNIIRVQGRRIHIYTKRYVVKTIS